VDGRLPRRGRPGHPDEGEALASHSRQLLLHRRGLLRRERVAEAEARCGGLLHLFLHVGVAEVLAAVGLMLPGLTRILPWLVSWAAAGIMIVMVSATIWNLVRGEMSSAAITLVLLAMATFVADMRHRVMPIPGRRGARTEQTA
jgi:hypothetical protein